MGMKHVAGGDVGPRDALSMFFLVPGGNSPGLGKRTPFGKTSGPGEGAAMSLGLRALRDGARGSYGLLNLESLEAGCAGPDALCGNAFLDADFLQVRVAAPPGGPKGMAAGVAEVRALTAGITDFRHEKSPVLGYRPISGARDTSIAVAVQDRVRRRVRAKIVPDFWGMTG